MTSTHRISVHANERVYQRFLKPEAIIHMATTYGRRVHGSGCMIYVIGKQEIKKYGKEAPEIRELNGLHVYVSYDNTIITVFQNEDLQVRRDYKSRHGARRKSERAA